MFYSVFISRPSKRITRVCLTHGERNIKIKKIKAVRVGFDTHI